MKNNECNIIQDLLPNYVEKLTSNETNIFIDEHLKNCENCNNILKNMEKDFEKTGNMQEKEINYAKKFNKKYKKAKYTSLIIIYSLIIVILAFLGYKLIVFNSLANKMEVYKDKTNYHIEAYNYQGKHFFTEEIWRNGEDYYRELNVNEFKHCLYFKENEYYDYLNGVWTLSEMNKDDAKDYISSDFNFIRLIQDELKTPLNILKFSLKKAYVNGKQCYCIINNSDGSGDIYYIEKETGLIVRYECLNGEMSNYNFDTNSREVQSTLIDFKYKFDIVTDKDFVIDNFEEYIEKEKSEETSFTNILNLRENLSKVKNVILNIENSGTSGNSNGEEYYIKDNIEVVKGSEIHWKDLTNKKSISVYTASKLIQVSNRAESIFDEIYNTILWNRRNGAIYTYIGKEKIGDFECHTITLTRENEEYRYSIDTETGLIIREEIKINFGEEKEELIRNYRYTFDTVTDEDIKEIDLNDYADYKIKY